MLYINNIICLLSLSRSLLHALFQRSKFLREKKIFKTSEILRIIEFPTTVHRAPRTALYKKLFVIIIKEMKKGLFMVIINISYEYKFMPANHNMNK